MGFAKGAIHPARCSLASAYRTPVPWQRWHFHHLVALLDQALAFAIFALGLLLDVRAFFIGHDGLQGEVRPLDCDRRIRIERLFPRQT